MDEILIQLTPIFEKVFSVSNIKLTEEITADDFEEWTSMNHTLLIAEIEEFYNIKFRLNEILEFNNVGDLCKTIKKKI